MNEQNNSLIGYLKKKSLFSDSPSKFLQLRERSKQKRSIGKQIRTPQTIYNINEESQQQSSKNMHQQSSFRNYKSQNSSQNGYHSMQVERPSRFNNSFQVEQNDQRQQTAKRNFHKTSLQNTNLQNTKYETKQEDTSNLWSGLVNYANSFQSSRIQSAQCLETISHNLQIELGNISNKLDVFQNRLLQMLSNQLAVAKKKIYSIVDKIFQQCEQNMRAYVKYQQQTLGRELLQMKQILSKEYQKVEVMKQQISKPNWRKVAGELLSTELQQKVEGYLNRSRNIDIKNWEVGDLGINKISSLQNTLRDMIKLTTH